MHKFKGTSTRSSFEVTEQLCILTVVAITQIYTWDRPTHTQTHKGMHVKKKEKKE